MQDVELFLSLAEIAGVFVGFGALIAVRSGGASAVSEVAMMRGVVSMGLLTVVAALAPVTLGRYSLAEHEAWALSSALALVLLVLFAVVMVMTPEYRQTLRTHSRFTYVEDGAAMLLDIVLVVLPIIIVLGLRPDLEAALYFTFVVLLLLGAGWVLLDLVFWQRRPTSG